MRDPLGFSGAWQNFLPLKLIFFFSPSSLGYAAAAQDEVFLFVKVAQFVLQRQFYYKFVLTISFFFRPYLLFFQAHCFSEIYSIFTAFHFLLSYSAKVSQLYQTWQNLMGIKMWKGFFSPIYFTVSLIFAAFMGLIQE